jgi:DNA-directed RNA polymerase alpha subunit
MGVKTVRDLVRLEPHELMRIPNFGRVSLREVEAELAQLKLHLGMDVSEKDRAN